MFTVIATITTTGLSVCDYTQWGTWITAIILFLSLIGGCTGSTSGSIKIFRWQVVYLFLHRYFLTIIEPHRVVPIKIGKVNLPEKASISVFVYMLSFIISLAFLTVLVSLCGGEISTALSSVSACITNVGVGAIQIIGPSGNYAFFNTPVKLILCCAMLIGRLEIITIFVLFSRSFWRS